MNSKGTMVLVSAMLLVAMISGSVVGAIQQVYAQNNSTTGTTDTSIVQDASALIIAVSGLAGALGIIIATLVPWIKKIDKASGEKAEKIANSLIETDHYGEDIAEKVNKNEAKIELALSALENLAHLSPEQKEQFEKLKATAQEKMKQATIEANKNREELDRLHSALPVGNGE